MESFSSPGDLPNPGIEPRSPGLQADSLPAEPQGKTKYTRVGGLYLLQGIFPTQESNRGLLYCRQILYQLSYQGTPGWSRELTILRERQTQRWMSEHHYGMVRVIMVLVLCTK